MAIAQGAYLLPAAFRGVPFLYTSSTTTGGRKFKDFEYPNKNTRFLEDLGKLQRTYKIQAIITGNDLEYPVQIKLFKEALETEGTGLLNHPTEGIIRVFATPYTLAESFDKVGVGTFSLTFFEVGTQTFPAGVDSLSAASKVAQNALEVISAGSQDFRSEWTSNKSFPTITIPSTQQLVIFSARMQEGAKLSTNNLDGLTTFNNTLAQYNTDIPINVLNAESLTNDTDQVFLDYGDISTTLTTQSQLMELFFAYTTPTNLPQTTTISESVERNRQLFNQYINLQALIFDYIFITQIEFETTDDIQIKSDILTQQFAFIIENNIYFDILGNRFDLLSNNTLSQLETIRFNAHTYLDQQTTTARKVIDITVQNASVLPLTYQYYGDLDNFETLITLNDLGFLDNLDGNFKVVSDAD